MKKLYTEMSGHNLSQLVTLTIIAMVLFCGLKYSKPYGWLLTQTTMEHALEANLRKAKTQKLAIKPIKAIIGTKRAAEK